MRILDPHAHARARARVLDAARSVFAAQGYHAASMNDVARAAGVTKAGLYHYFEGKHALLEALHTDLWDESAARLLAAPKPKGLREALRYIGGEYLEHFQDPRHSEMMRIAFNVSVVEPELLRLSSGMIMPRLQAQLVAYFRPCFPAGMTDADVMLHVLPFIGALFYYLFVIQATCPREQLPCSSADYLEHLVSVFAVVPARKETPVDKPRRGRAPSQGTHRPAAPAAPRRRTRGHS